MSHVVAVHGLFLRSAPAKVKGNELAVLPEGTKVTVSDKSNALWWRVTGVLNGAPFDGFAASKHLRPAGSVSFSTASKIVPVHWRENNPASKRSGAASASPIGEAGMPRKPVGKASDLDSLIDWLDVANSRRYRPGSGLTYCNIYAYDVAYGPGVYLPRVWWTSKAIADLAAGKTVTANYGVTVREMNANAIHDWLQDYGPQFGWKRTFSVNDLQDCANRGGIATICAKRKDVSRSGHIVIIAPESAAAKARRDGSGKVVMPVQSQAGAVNFKRKTPASAWWSDPKFSSFVLYTNG